MSLADMRAELRALRKDYVKPVSRMRKGDISAELEKLRAAREETPAVAAVPSAKSKQMTSSVESIKKAKASEFPVKPAAKAAPPKKAAAPAAKARMSKAQMRALLDEMTSDEE